MPAINRRQYQGDWSSWVFYGTHRFWQRAQSEPWHASELIIQRLHLAGLECPSEACSADIVCGHLGFEARANGDIAVHCRVDSGVQCIQGAR